jgi:GT2 family glycosyltransferase
LEYLEGDLAVFTDDDVFPDPGWLVELRKAANYQPGYSIFGGAIEPRWESTPGPWVWWVPSAPAFTLTDSGLAAGPVDPGFLYGPNMAVRAEVFYAGTRFDPAIGPNGTEYPMGSESELLLRLRRQGHKSWFVKQAVVEHYIRKHQTEKSWMLRRAVRFGRGQLRLSRSYGSQGNSYLLGVPLRLYLRMFKRLALIAFAWARPSDKQLFLARWELNYLWGHVVEARLLGNKDQDGGKRAAFRKEMF